MGVDNITVLEGWRLGRLYHSQKNEAGSIVNMNTSAGTDGDPECLLSQKKTYPQELHLGNMQATLWWRVYCSPEFVDCRMMEEESSQIQETTR